MTFEHVFIKRYVVLIVNTASTHYKYNNVLKSNTKSNTKTKGVQR